MFNLLKTLVVLFIITFAVANTASQTNAAGNDPVKKTSTMANGFVSIRAGYLPNVEGIIIAEKSRNEYFICFTDSLNLVFQVANEEGKFMYAFDIKTNTFQSFHYKKGYKYTVHRKTSTPCRNLCMHLETEILVFANDAKTNELLNAAQK